MNKKITYSIVLVVLLIVGGALYHLQNISIFKQNTKDTQDNQEISIIKDKDYWKDILTPEQYKVLREAGTEAPFSGALNYEERKGTYYSVGCDKPLFRSEQKYDSGTGWPSFWAPIAEDAVVLHTETGLFGDRTEVLDPCGSHLGHVFDDGPQPTGKRYCMNSVAMYFVPDGK